LTLIGDAHGEIRLQPVHGAYRSFNAILVLNQFMNSDVSTLMPR
jgi:hypothetical protein